ncbi:MAG: cobalamin-dependent protein [Chitinophagaceae bacterium]|nr:cobalamin-dependent protein [Chitinophagaceae bacterium]
MNKQNAPRIRIVTAASLFDGHDAAINIMRRLLQQKGAEVIHLGHNRSVHEIVECAIEEDAHAVAVTSYQGGHMEFFRYMKDLLQESGCGHIKIFGGGGGTILPHEAETLHQYGINRIYSPDDGRKMGLEGMIQDVITQCTDTRNYDEAINKWGDALPLNELKDIRVVARAISLAENGDIYDTLLQKLQRGRQEAIIPVVGITGTGGAGKSSVTDELVRRYLQAFPAKTIAVISVDPSKRKTGGALLGDRIRMNAVSNSRVYMRSLATREDNTSVSKSAKAAIDICKKAGYDCIILETAGTGQSDVSITEYSDICMYVMTPEYGAASQLEKINMLDYADIIAINKADKPGADDALNDVRKQYKRNHQLFSATPEQLPVISMCANKFNDAGVNSLFQLLLETIKNRLQLPWLHEAETFNNMLQQPQKNETIIPADRVRYLSEISKCVRDYNSWVTEQSKTASQLYQLNGAIEILKNK